MLTKTAVSNELISNKYFNDAKHNNLNMCIILIVYYK